MWGVKGEIKEARVAFFVMQMRRHFAAEEGEPWRNRRKCAARHPCCLGTKISSTKLCLNMFTDEKYLPRESFSGKQRRIAAAFFSYSMS